MGRARPSQQHAGLATRYHCNPPCGWRRLCVSVGVSALPPRTFFCRGHVSHPRGPAYSGTSRSGGLPQFSLPWESGGCLSSCPHRCTVRCGWVAAPHSRRAWCRRGRGALAPRLARVGPRATPPTKKKLIHFRAYDKTKCARYFS